MFIIADGCGDDPDETGVRCLAGNYLPPKG
jgi:hypothetical protein